MWRSDVALLPVQELLVIPLNPWAFAVALALIIAMAARELWALIGYGTRVAIDDETWSHLAAENPLAGVLLAILVAAIAGALIYHLLSQTGLFS